MEVRLIGVYRKIAGKDRLLIKKAPKTIGSLLQDLCSRLGSDFKNALLDPELNDPRPNALILINGREINTINGLKSKIKSGDSIIIIPISHGG